MFSCLFGPFGSTLGAPNTAGGPFGRNMIHVYEVTNAVAVP
jgi:hypothetical protein